MATNDKTRLNPATGSVPDNTLAGHGGPRSPRDIYSPEHLRYGERVQRDNSSQRPEKK